MTLDRCYVLSAGRQVELEPFFQQIAGVWDCVSTQYLKRPNSNLEIQLDFCKILLHQENYYGIQVFLYYADGRIDRSSIDLLNGKFYDDCSLPDRYDDNGYRHFDCRIGDIDWFEYFGNIFRFSVTQSDLSQNTKRTCEFCIQLMNNQLTISCNYIVECTETKLFTFFLKPKENF